MRSDSNRPNSGNPLVSVCDIQSGRCRGVAEAPQVYIDVHQSVIRIDDESLCDVEVADDIAVRGGEVDRVSG